jgi:dihydrodipicolinate synthase/N-acetylneuraminate lyase
MPWSSNDIRGFVVPVPTPFQVGGAVDEACLRQLVDFYVDAHVDAMFFLGSFGNGPALRPDERKRVAEVALDQLRGRLPALVHVGAVDPQTTCDLAVHAQAYGADAVAVVGPYYYSDHAEWEIVEHFRLVGEAVQLPILVYNNAEYSGYNIPPLLMAKLRQAAPRIFGSKLAMGTTQEAMQYLRVLKDGFTVFVTPYNLVPGMAWGVGGTISPPLAPWPELGVELIRTIDARDWTAAIALQRRVFALSDCLAPFKAHGRGTQGEMFKARGFPVAQYPRWPTMPFTDDERASLRAALREVGFPVREAVPA